MTAPTTMRIVFPHQLFQLQLDAPTGTVFILIEDDLYYRQYPFHKHKLLMHRASMQSFKDALVSKGFETIYIETSSERTSMDNLHDVLLSKQLSVVQYYDVVDNWLDKRINDLFTSLSIDSERLTTPGFLTTPGQIEDYFDTHPNRMQQFYIWQRKRLAILVEDGNPTGGKWSYDESNRKKLPKNVSVPKRYENRERDYIQDAREWVSKNFPSNPGDIQSFYYPVTHEEALEQLNLFLHERLEHFGPYEDAISATHDQLFHSLLSAPLNIGLLTPKYVVERTLMFSEKHTIPIESLEGFIRQIIGWREYMRATYTRMGTKMRTSNYLGFNRSLPSSWWTAEVGIEPIDTTIARVLNTAYAHHIERLMILGNSMVLLRIHPDEVYEWFMSLFIDAYDWVMVPNVYAMSQFAAGEVITTKPYISGSNYIIKMSDYKKGSWSGIWDALYWEFIKDYREIIEKNHRSRMVASLYDRFNDDKKKSFSTIAEKWLQ